MKKGLRPIVADQSIRRAAFPGALMKKGLRLVVETDVYNCVAFPGALMKKGLRHEHEVVRDSLGGFSGCPDEEGITTRFPRRRST